MTTRRPADIPSIDNPLACLLPLGSATFVERIMESCALAGLRHIDVVLSDHPESVRAAIGDGSAWGLNLSWHLVKDPVMPYKVLRSLNISDDELVVIGHAHQWVSERLITALQQRPGTAMHVSQSVFWCGWYSDTGNNVCNVDSYGDYSSLSKLVASLTIPCVLAQQDEFANAGNASELLQAQGMDLGDLNRSVPASWRRMPWGAMSPDATVSADATIEGPVLIGPGCVVDASSQIGPNVILSRDIFVSNGAQVRHCVVLANTYVDGRVTLDQVVVQGNTVQSLKWNARTVLPQEDAMLTPLINTTRSRTPLVSRVLGIVLAVLFFPWLLLLTGLQWVLQRRVLWNKTHVVKSRDFDTGALLMVTIRQPHSAHWLNRCVGFYGAVIDVIQGNRRFFGLRPRNTSEWYALSREWQNLFSNSMLGVFHALSWSKYTAIPDNESLAVADAFMAVHSTLRDRLVLVTMWAFMVIEHCCPVKTRTKSTGCERPVIPS